MARVTVVNDNPEFLALVRDILEGDRYDTTTIDGDRADALEQIRASRPDLLMIDLRMGSAELHGWGIAQQIRADPDFDGMPILICSADAQAVRDLEQDMAATQQVSSLLKPFGIDALIRAIDGLIATSPAR